jgi:hypothetical protein
VENRGKKAGFAKMRRVDKVDAKNICSIADGGIEDGRAGCKTSYGH